MQPDYAAGWLMHIAWTHSHKHAFSVALCLDGRAGQMVSSKVSPQYLVAAILPKTSKCGLMVKNKVRTHFETIPNKIRRIFFYLKKFTNLSPKSTKNWGITFNPMPHNKIQQKKQLPFCGSKDRSTLNCGPSPLLFCHIFLI